MRRLSGGPRLRRGLRAVLILAKAVSSEKRARAAWWLSAKPRTRGFSPEARKASSAGRRVTGQRAQVGWSLAQAATARPSGEASAARQSRGVRSPGKNGVSTATETTAVAPSGAAQCRAARMPARGPSGPRRPEPAGRSQSGRHRHWPRWQGVRPVVPAAQWRGRSGCRRPRSAQPCRRRPCAARLRPQG